MKPAFALDFRDDSIGLLHRSGSVWQVVGSVPIDAPDLSEALNYLRSTAVGLSPRGMATKLIIPNDQILYTSVSVTATDDAARRAEVAAALEGRTPYAVEELQFDYHGDGPEVLVAVIANETLAEAEAFAVEHRFNPLSFVAVPDDAAFGGEAWFGATAHAAELLQPGDSVERDKKAVVTQARSFAPPPVIAPQAVDIPAEKPTPAPVVEVPIVEEPIVEDPVVEIPPPEEPAYEDPIIDEPFVEDPDLPEELPDGLPELPPEPFEEPDFDLAPKPVVMATAGIERLDFEVEPEDNRALAKALGETLSEPLPVRAPVAAPAPRPPAPPQPEAAEAPMALDVQPDDPMDDDEPQGAGAIAAALSAQSGPKIASARVIDPKIEDDLPPAPAGAALAAFASRRQGPTAAPSLGAAERSLQRPAAAKPIPTAKPVRSKVEKPTKSALRGLTDLVKPSAKLPEARSLDGIAAAVAAPPITAAAAVSKPTAGVKRADLNRGPGGFGTLRPAPTRGKPRYLGLFLTVLLLFLLAMVAAWSSYSLGAWNTTSEPAVQTAEDATPADMTTDTPDATDEMLADMQDPDAMTVEDATDPATDTTDVTSNVPADGAEPAATAAPVTAVASEPTAAPNPTSGTQDEIFLATIDPPPAAPDPLSLQQPEARGDPLPDAQAAPPPYGTVYQFTADGLIRPTPEGIITPEGVMLLAGKPKLVPPVRPQTVTELAIASKSASPTAEPVVATTANLAPASPNMIGAKPKPRPDGLVPVAAPADQGSLAPAPGSRFASIRPQARPKTVLSAGEQAKIASAAATLAAQPAIDAAVSEAAANAADMASTSKLAVSISRKPAARPKDMSRSVEAAVAAAVRTPEPTQDAAAAAPEDDGEPELASAAPKIPTKATVAKQATFSNVLNLSQVNLIGIYGTQNKRYALIRQPNGRYKKVKVGDSIDNGKIVAITASELRYQKRGKLLALAMPKT